MNTGYKPPPLESRFSSSPEPLSPLSDILNQPNPKQSLLEDLLETSDRITQRKITDIEIMGYDTRQEFLARLNEGMQDYARRSPSMPHTRILAEAKALLAQEELKIKKTVREMVAEVLEEKRKRNEAIRTYVEKNTLAHS